MNIVALIKHNKYLDSFFRKGIIYPLCDINPIFATKLLYKISTGKTLNLINPQTFNEKLQYLKLYVYANDPRITLAVDKYRIREYLKKYEGGVQLTNDLTGKGFYESVNDIKIDELPDKFVLKCNHDSGSVVICKDKKYFDWEKEKVKLDKSLHTDYWKNNVELQYRKVKKGIVCEKYLEDESGGLVDYKFHCFNGIPRLVYCTNPHEEGEKLEMNFFDMNFCKVEIHRKGTKDMPKLPSKPEQFDKMVEIASKLSKPYPFVRVDLFLCKGKIYLGELTFIPTAGMGKFEEAEVDLMLGGWIKLDRE